MTWVWNCEHHHVLVRLVLKHDLRMHVLLFKLYL